MDNKKIFISHISDETELAQALQQQLERYFPPLRDNIFVSSDIDSIQPGEDWLQKVQEALKSAGLQIVLCSPESVGRPWVNFEIGAAWAWEIPAIPLCHSGMQPGDLPRPWPSLRLEGVEYSQPEGLRKLYHAIAEKLHEDAPDLDFDKMAAELKGLEEEYVREREGPEKIDNPRILCAASEQYLQRGFNLDVQVLKTYFPKSVEIERKLTAQLLRMLLTTQCFDIVHLVLWVDPATGALIFDPIDFTAQKPTKSSSDSMSAEDFAALLVESKTKLVVLATSHASLLAYKVAMVANMAATDRDIGGEAAARWEDCFYSWLAQGMSLYDAFDKTEKQVSTPIKGLKHKDIVFAVSKS